MRPSIAAGLALRVFHDLPGNRDTVVERLRRSLSDTGLECGCRDTAHEMLDRVCAEEERVRRAGGLSDARKMRDAIVLVVGLLDELDDLRPDESDPTVFAEIAHLFRDISDFAAFGAGAALRAGGRNDG